MLRWGAALGEGGANKAPPKQAAAASAIGEARVQAREHEDEQAQRLEPPGRRPHVRGARVRGVRGVPEL